MTKRRYRTIKKPPVPSKNIDPDKLAATVLKIRAENAERKLKQVKRLFSPNGPVKGLRGVVYRQNMRRKPSVFDAIDEIQKLVTKITG